MGCRMELFPLIEGMTARLSEWTLSLIVKGEDCGALTFLQA